MSVLVVYVKGAMSGYFSIFIKNLKGVLVSIEFSLVLLSYGTESVSCRCVVTDAKDGNGLKLEKNMGQFFARFDAITI